MRTFAGDMNLLTDHIEYLLRHHDCVVVPGLGAFIAQYQSARFDDESGRIMPPCRCVAFNGSITHNDGLLASSVARQLGISYDSAVTKVSDESAQLRKKIYEEGKVTFGTLGAFRSASADSAVEFLPNSEAGRSAEMYHLKSIAVSKLAHAGYTPCAESLVRPIAVSSPRFAVFMKIAAALALIATLALSFIRIQTLTASEEVSYASLSPAHTVNMSSISETESVKELVSLPLLALPEGMGSAEYSPITSATTNYYYIIVASFPTKGQALRYIEEFKDSSLHIIEDSTRVRVHTGVATTLQEAIAKSKYPKIADRYKDVWIHRQ